MLSLAEARQKLCDSVTPTESIKVLHLASALACIAARDVISDYAIPPQDNSAMDGFAINSESLAQQSSFEISQRIPAGAQPTPLQQGTAARIFTGGVVPVGADAVVIQENCEFDTTQVKVLKPVDKGANIRPKAQDIQIGAKIVEAGKKLSAIDLSLLASIGRAKVEVRQPIRVAIFSTGDELIDPGQPLEPGQIYNSNRPLLVGLCQQLGYEVIDCGLVEDSLEATKAALAEAAANADFVISSGGVSVGEEDHVKPAVESLGRLDLWKIQMKPGKPVAFGFIEQTPFLGLPGNPVSSFVVFQLIGRPLLQRRQGQRSEAPIEYPVVAGFTKKLSQREEYIRVKIKRSDDGQLVAKPFGNLSSGVMSSLSWADGLLKQKADTAIEIGQPLDFLPLYDGLL